MPVGHSHVPRLPAPWAGRHGEGSSCGGRSCAGLDDALKTIDHWNGPSGPPALFAAPGCPGHEPRL